MTWITTNNTSKQSNHTITNLINGNEYFVKIRATNEYGTVESNEVSVIPSETSFDQLSVDDYITDMNDPINVRSGIIEANNVANNQGYQLIFSDAEYVINDSIVISNANWRGVLGGTVIKRTGGYMSYPFSNEYINEAPIEFTGNYIVRDIIFDFDNSSNTGILTRTNGVASILDCVVKNVLHQQGSEGVNLTTHAGIRIENNPTLEIKRTIIHDLSSSVPRNVGSTIPRVRGIHIISPSNANTQRNILIEECDIYNLTSTVGYGGPYGGMDVDGIVIRDNDREYLGTKTTTIRNCRFWSIEKRFIKGNNPDNVIIENCDFITKSGERLLEPVAIQEQSRAVITGNKFIFERGRDAPQNRCCFGIGGTTSVANNWSYDWGEILIDDNELIIENNDDFYNAGGTRGMLFYIDNITRTPKLRVRGNILNSNNDGAEIREFIVFIPRGRTTSQGDSNEYGFQDVLIENNDTSKMNITDHILSIYGLTTGDESYFNITSQNNDYSGTVGKDDSTLPNNWNDSRVSSGSSYNGQIKS